MLFRSGVLLNVNVPAQSRRSPGAMLAAKMTTLGQRVFDRDTIIAKADPRGRQYYWIGENRIGWRQEKEADYYAVDDGLVSITPLHLDLTHHATVERFRGWEALLRPRRHNNG